MRTSRARCGGPTPHALRQTDTIQSLDNWRQHVRPSAYYRGSSFAPGVFRVFDGPEKVPTLVSRFTNPRPPVQNGTAPKRAERFTLTQGAVLRRPVASEGT